MLLCTGNTRVCALTDRGLALREVIVALECWGAAVS